MEHVYNFGEYAEICHLPDFFELEPLRGIYRGPVGHEIA